MTNKYRCEKDVVVAVLEVNVRYIVQQQVCGNTFNERSRSHVQLEVAVISVVLSAPHFLLRVQTKLCVAQYTLCSETRGQNNLTKSASRGAHSPVRGHPRGSKFVPLNSWGRGSY